MNPETHGAVVGSGEEERSIGMGINGGHGLGVAAEGATDLKGVKWESYRENKKSAKRILLGGGGETKEM